MSGREWGRGEGDGRHTSESVSVGFQSAPCLLKICTSFEFRLTATSLYPRSEHRDITQTEERTAAVRVERVRRDAGLAQRVDFGGCHWDSPVVLLELVFIL